jgi:DNA-binding GntR family transcriptional regulator
MAVALGVSIPTARLALNNLKELGIVSVRSETMVSDISWLA